MNEYDEMLRGKDDNHIDECRTVHHTGAKNGARWGANISQSLYGYSRFG